eukprot:1704228-Pyramimonas_sp.AAC.1
MAKTATEKNAAAKVGARDRARILSMQQLPESGPAKCPIRPQASARNALLAWTISCLNELRQRLIAR